jgi:hypothetical protein
VRIDDQHLPDTGWTHDDSWTAMQEGWDIFDCDGSDNGPYQLCVLDEPILLPELGYTEPKFTGDTEAWIHVRTQAREHDSPLHQKALTFLYTHCPAEYQRIMDA